MLTFPQLVKKFRYCVEPEDLLPYPSTPPTLPTLRLIDVIHCTPSYFFNIHFTLFSYFHPDLSRNIFHSEFTHQNSIYASPLPFAFYMPRLSNSSRFDHRNNIWRGIHTMKLHIVRFSPGACYLVPLRPKCLPHHPIFDHFKPIFFPQPESPKWTKIRSITQIIWLCVLIFTILDNEGGYRRLYRTVACIPTFQIIQWQQITNLKGGGRILSWSNFQEYQSMSRDELNNPTKTRTILIHDAVEIRTTCVSHMYTETLLSVCSVIQFAFKFHNNGG